MKHGIIVMIVLSSVMMSEPVSAESSPRAISPPGPETAASMEESGSTIPGRSLGTSIAALGAILLLFLGVVQVWKKYTLGNQSELPAAAWELLGKAPLDGRQNLMIVRIGSRLLVLGQSDQGLQTLSEITQSEEVGQLMAICHSSESFDKSSSFDELISRFSQRSQDLPVSSSEEARSA